jgi:hypothetical protein
MTDGHAVAGGQVGSNPRAEPSYSEGSRYSDIGEPRGYGWVVFAGVMLLMAGTVNVIYGIAAVSKSHFYIANTHFVFSELNTWGWIVLAIGALEICVGLGVWAQAAWARWTGVVIAGLNAIAQLLFIAAYPLLSLAIFSLDVLVIYALVAYGGKLEES